MSTSKHTPPMDSQPTTALDLKRGARAVVLGVNAKAADAERLNAMGLSTGSTLRVVRPAPMLAVEVGSSTLALGAAWGRALHVLSVEQ